ncbi:MAG: SWIM zinc finger family protein [Microthrixaceae bacterium]
MSNTPRFGRTWWGRAWVSSLERSGETYQTRLPAGRSYARKGAVRELELLPGHLAARVVGTHGEIHQVDIAVKTLAPSEWDQVADSIGSHASHLAALLDGEIHPNLIDDMRRMEVHLLPGPSELRPDCTCEDWAEPCRHAAAVCYVAAEALDRDPFALFLLRGMNRNDLISLVRSRRSGEPTTGPEAQDTEPEGVDPADIWLGRSIGDDLSEPPQPSEAEIALHNSGPGHRSEWPAEIPPRYGVVPARIDAIGDDAVIRAWRVTEYGDESMLGLDARSDLARRASAADWPSAVQDLASLGGVTTQHLTSWMNAWRVAGSEGVAAVADRRSWVKDPDLLAEGREQLVSLGLDRRSIAVNYDSIGMSPGIVLVLSPSGLWFRLQGGGSHQDLALSRGPSRDITELIDLS